MITTPATEIRIENDDDAAVLTVSLPTVPPPSVPLPSAGVDALTPLLMTAMLLLSGRVLSRGSRRVVGARRPDAIESRLRV